MTDVVQGADMPAQPDKVIPLGSVGELDIDFTRGLASVKISVKVPGGVGIMAAAEISMDSEQLLNAIFGAIESKLGAGSVPLAESVKSVLVNAVKAIP